MITSTSNDRIKNIVKLCTSSKARREQDAFVAEGIKMFIEAPLVHVREVYVSEELEGRLKAAEGDCLLKECAARLKESGYEAVSTQVFKKMAETMTPQGILCVVDMEHPKLEEITGREGSLHVLILEGIQDPGNLGTMIRTAEAAGYDLILADENTVDVYNPKVIRSTMGSVYRVPVIYSRSFKEDIDRLKEAGVTLFAAHLKGTKAYDEVDCPVRAGIMIGNEGRGLSDEIAGMADEYVKIPMKGQVESLNAAVAVALMMFRLR